LWGGGGLPVVAILLTRAIKIQRGKERCCLVLRLIKGYGFLHKM
jgi:hypothetical protein